MLIFSNIKAAHREMPEMFFPVLLDFLHLHRQLPAYRVYFLAYCVYIHLEDGMDRNL